jgi:hypothetical protein
VTASLVLIKYVHCFDNTGKVGALVGCASRKNACGPGWVGCDYVLPLFGPGSLGLDSVDALQIVVTLDKNYGLKIPDAEAAKKVLQSVNTIVAALEERLPVKPH